MSYEVAYEAIERQRLFVRVAVAFATASYSLVFTYFALYLVSAGVVFVFVIIIKNHPLHQRKNYGQRPSH